MPLQKHIIPKMDRAKFTASIAPENTEFESSEIFPVNIEQIMLIIIIIGHRILSMKIPTDCDNYTSEADKILHDGKKQLFSSIKYIY